MKKYTLFLFLFVLGFFSLFNINVNSANAYTAGCQSGDNYSRTTGEICHGGVSFSECKPSDLFNSTTGKPCPTVSGGDDSGNSQGDSSDSVAKFNELFKSSFKIGKRGDDIKALQQFLKDEGYYFGKVDGKYGRVTARAVKDFQDDNDINVISGGGSSIVPLSCSSLQQTQRYYYNICKDSGFENVCFNKDGVYQGCGNNANNGCTVNNTNASTNISCSVGAKQPTIITSTDQHGKIYPSGNIVVPIGSNKTFTFTPDPGYQVSNINIDNRTSAPVASSYTFYNVTGSHIIGVSFTPLAKTDLSITTASPLPNAKVGQPYSTELVVSGEGGGSGSSYKWSVNNGEAVFPILGLGLSSSYGNPIYITGTPDKQTIPQTFTFNVTVTLDSQSTTKQFTLTVDPATTTQPSITVLSPNGGEKWRVGETHRITWQSVGVAKVKLYVYAADGAGPGSASVNNISDIMPDVGYHDWTIVKNLLPDNSNLSGGYFQIRVDGMDNENNVIVREVRRSAGNSWFTITTPAPTITFSLNETNGDLSVSSGAKVTFSWSSTNATSCLMGGLNSGPTGPISGTYTVTATATGSYPYTVTCTGTGGTTTQNRTLTVTSPDIGLVGPVSGDNRISVTTIVGQYTKAFTIRSTTARSFYFYGSPTNYGPGINFAEQSGGIVPGGQQDVRIQVNSNVPVGSYAGTVHLRTSDPGVTGEITFPITVNVVSAFQPGCASTSGFSSTTGAPCGN